MAVQEQKGWAIAAIADPEYDFTDVYVTQGKVFKQLASLTSWRYWR